jgi:hypothetical protein
MMTRLCYDPEILEKFQKPTLAKIAVINGIIAEYQQQGYRMTLRQLYYQLVSRDIIRNMQTEYDNLGKLLRNARYAGLVDWEAIHDQTRFPRSLAHWRDAQDRITQAAQTHRLDRWTDQENRVEIWIEKDALLGVCEGTAQQLDCPIFSNRGYMSASAMWETAQYRIIARQRRDTPQGTIIVHLGDCDPSGQDMSRDLEKRLTEFCEFEGYDGPRFVRIALNMDQVNQYQPPPNPVKPKDSRTPGYRRKFGNKCWELDALRPGVINGLIAAEVDKYRDMTKWNATVAKEAQEKELLTDAAEAWPSVVEFLASCNESPFIQYPNYWDRGSKDSGQW